MQQIRYLLAVFGLAVDEAVDDEWLANDVACCHSWVQGAVGVLEKTCISRRMARICFVPAW